MDKAMVNFMIDREWLERADAVAKAKRWTRSELIRYSVEQTVTTAELQST